MVEPHPFAAANSMKACAQRLRMPFCYKLVEKTLYIFYNSNTLLQMKRERRGRAVRLRFIQARKRKTKR
ncbi:hypothetical protein B0W44_10520 [Novibacillus thermophilus]|uniref:Uncharacterized protein n=1 Tax=Novibacillus thermophilus TaxID=1471761 RepID=A0A1U9K7W7_9BACL|nr:hypothetical protein B0W44_10520 [Novibacillus thermophilus]